MLRKARWWLICLVLGASLTLSYAPFDLWWLAPLSFTCFFYLTQRLTDLSTTTLTWWFSLGWFGAGISWVHVSIADFGGLPLIASVALMLLLCGYLALYPTLAMFVGQRWFSFALWPLVLPFIWLFTEWLRSWLLTGFPWLSIGYSQLTSPLAGWLPVIGETGVSALIVLVSAASALAILNHQWRNLSIIIAVPLFSGWVLNSVHWSVPTGEKLKTAIIQGNVKQELRWVPEQDKPTMDAYIEMTSEYLGHDLIVWPEAAIPKLEPLAQEYLELVDGLTADANSSLITGIVNYNFESGDVFNSLIVVGDKHRGDDTGHYRYFHNNRFDKHHLLPIGEFVPFEKWLRRLAPIFDLPMSSFSRGDFQQRNLIANDVHIAPALCFEIAFPRQVRANLYADTQLLLTVSNDAWFGKSHGPAQHMQIAQVRAKEFGLPLVRATNNGISAFVDHLGHQRVKLPQFERTTASHDIQLVEGRTPYREWGDWLIWLITLVFFGLGCRLKKSNDN